MPNRTRILLAEDEPEIREVVAELLTDCGYNVTEAKDGIEALEKLASIHPPPPPLLIVTDIHMPRLDGFEFVRTVRSQPLLEKTPVIFLTASRYKNTEDEVYVRKPFGLNELLSAITLLEKESEGS